MQKQALGLALNKAGEAASSLDWLFAGDLLNQCIGSSFGLREFGAALLRALRRLLHHGGVPVPGGHDH